MFEHYESDQDRKKRELAAQQTNAPAQTGPARRRGWSAAAGIGRSD